MHEEKESKKAKGQRGMRGASSASPDAVLRLRDLVALFAAAVAFFLATQSTSDAELELAW